MHGINNRASMRDIFLVSNFIYFTFPHVRFRTCGYWWQAFLASSDLGRAYSCYIYTFTLESRKENQDSLRQKIFPFTNEFPIYIVCEQLAIRIDCIDFYD